METNTALIPLQEQYIRSIDTIKNGSTILQENELLVSKIVESGKNIINRIQANGGVLTPELDKLCNDYIARANVRLKEMNERRAPITQMLTAVQKMFTSLEGRLDIKKPDTEMAIIQNFRNQYAKMIAEEAKRRQEEADRKAKKAQEAISIKANAVTALNTYILTVINDNKRKLYTLFENSTLETLDEVSKKIATYNPAFDYSVLEGFKHKLYAYTHTLDEITAIVDQVKSEKFEEFKNMYISQMGDYKVELMNKLPSKRNELNEIAKASEEKRKQLEEEAKRRQLEEDERIKREQEEAAKKAHDQALAQAEAEKTMVMFEKEAEIAVAPTPPQAREGYEINVLMPAGWVQIFQLWWEHEGRSLPNEKLEKKTMGSMKKFCESLAHKKDIKIESQFLEYNTIYKAVNKK